jgi:hypothetical protein
MQYLCKIIFTLLMVVAITEATKRFGFLGALLAALPILSILSMIWIYVDTGDIQKVSKFSTEVVWCVLPSLGMFLALPLLLKRMTFYPSLCISMLVTLLLYLVMLWIFRLLDYKI